MPVITFAPIPYGMEVVLTGHVVTSGKPLVTVLHGIHDTDATPDPTAMSALATAINAAVVAAWSPTVSDNVQFDGTSVKSLAEDPAPSVFETLVRVGGITGDMLPPQTSALIRLATTAPGRSGKGRIYHWPTTESQQNGGLIGGGYHTALLLFYTALSLAFTTGLSKWAVFSKTNNTLAEVNGMAIQPGLKTIRNREY